MKRRNFLRKALAGSTLTMMGLPTAKTRAVDPGFSNYKALVCVFLDGGNDAWNSFVPIGSSGNSGYGKYAEGRADLAVENNSITIPTSLSDGTANPYYSSGKDADAYLKGHYALSGISEVGINGLMPELAWLLNDGKASLVGNVGTLVEPLDGKSDYQNANKKKPAFLFAHNHQTRVLQTGKADDLNTTGWAGRLADLWGGINGGSVMGLNVSFRGQVRLMTGSQSQPVLFSPGSAISYSALENEVGNNLKQSRRTLFQTLFGSNATNDPFINVYNGMLKRSLDLNDLLATYWTDNQKHTFTSKGPYAEELFGIPTKTQTGMEDELEGDLIEQLETVAQLIYLGSTSSRMALNRQIFFVHFGGFDTHGNQAEEHPLLLREFSIAMYKFQKALVELSLDTKVATFTLSDFGRTISNNGDGTDHAWSTINTVMSNASSFNGGKFYGSLPDFTMGGSKDIKDKGKGRFVPEISVDQMNATLCSWFGVPASNMTTLFPNLGNFKSNSDIETAYLSLGTKNLI